MSSFSMEEDLAILQGAMGWTDDTLLHLLKGFIEDRRLKDACVEYLYERAESESMEET
jgi:hypothetical protein